MIKDDRGTNILIEYILTLCILAILFAVLLTTVNTTLRNANTSVVGEQLEIIANDIANRISVFSNEVALSQSTNAHYTTTVSDYTATFELVALTQGDQYYIEITSTWDNVNNIWMGKVKVSYVPTPTIYKEITFRSHYEVTSIPFYNTNGEGEIHFDGTKITITG